MIYNFWIFITFLILTLGIYYVIPSKFRQGWILLLSYVFCLSYGIKSFYILACSTLISYLFGIMVDETKRRDPEGKKRLICLWIGIIFCVVPLLVGKITQYSMFVGIGVSFYLLQEIGYLADIYYGKCYAEKNLIRYALFIAFFPKLVSGPIERSGNLLKQIDEINLPAFDYEKVKSGLLLMLWGYFQKVIIADSLSVYVAAVYDHWEGYAGGTLCLASIAFAFQLYADFAGYTNIALGAAQALGFELMPNFKQPYLSDSIKEFWHRWHISLSSWLRDYIYIPLGGSRRGNERKYINLMITFGISGLWHGAGLNYIAWGMLHGIFQAAETIFSKVRLFKGRRNAFWKIIKRVWVFILVDLAWIFFRASSLRAALGILFRIIFDFSAERTKGDLCLSLNLKAVQIVSMICGILLLLVIDLLREKEFCIREYIGKKPIYVRWICYMGIVLVLTLVGMRRWGMEASSFFYTQF